MHNNYTVTTVMVTVVHSADQPPSSVVADIDLVLTRRAPSSWGLGKVVASSSVGTSAFGEDEIDWRDHNRIGG